MPTTIMNEQRIQEYLKQHAKLCQTRVASAEEKTLDKIVGTLWKLMTKEERKEAERRLKRKETVGAKASDEKAGV